MRQNGSEVVEVVEAKTVGSGAGVSDVDTEELRRRVEKAMAIKSIATSLSQLQEVAELMGYGPDWAPREAQRLGFFSDPAGGPRVLTPEEAECLFKKSKFS